MLRRSWFILAPALTAAWSATPKTRIALAGDSTVTDKAGWGAAFAKLLVPEAECLNFAASGRSSKSFRDEGRWQKVLASKPSFILIQFGHNDMPGKGPERETDPATTFQENLSRYIDEARAVQAQPILVTSLARRVFENGKLRGELRPWADAAAKVAQEKKVPLVDLFARSMALHEQLGQEKSDAFNPPSRNGKTDRTHLNPYGAQIIAQLIAEELRKVAPECARLIR